MPVRNELQYIGIEGLEESEKPEKVMDLEFEKSVTELEKELLEFEKNCSNNDIESLEKAAEQGEGAINKQELIEIKARLDIKSRLSKAINSVRSVAEWASDKIRIVRAKRVWKKYYNTSGSCSWDQDKNVKEILANLSPEDLDDIPEMSAYIAKSVDDLKVKLKSGGVDVDGEAAKRLWSIYDCLSVSSEIRDGLIDRSEIVSFIQQAASQRLFHGNRLERHIFKEAQKFISFSDQEIDQTVEDILTNYYNGSDRNIYYESDLWKEYKISESVRESCIFKYISKDLTEGRWNLEVNRISEKFNYDLEETINFVQVNKEEFIPSLVKIIEEYSNNDGRSFLVPRIIAWWGSSFGILLNQEDFNKNKEDGQNKEGDKSKNIDQNQEASFKIINDSLKWVKVINEGLQEQLESLSTSQDLLDWDKYGAINNLCISFVSDSDVRSEIVSTYENKTRNDEQNYFSLIIRDKIKTIIEKIEKENSDIKEENTQPLSQDIFQDYININLLVNKYSLDIKDFHSPVLERSLQSTLNSSLRDFDSPEAIKLRQNQKWVKKSLEEYTEIFNTALIQEAVCEGVDKAISKKAALSLADYIKLCDDLGIVISDDQKINISSFANEYVQEIFTQPGGLAKINGHDENGQTFYLLKENLNRIRKLLVMAPRNSESAGSVDNLKVENTVYSEEAKKQSVEAIIYALSNSEISIRGANLLIEEMITNNEYAQYINADQRNKFVIAILTKIISEKFCDPEDCNELWYKIGMGMDEIKLEFLQMSQQLSENNSLDELRNIYRIKNYFSADSMLANSKALLAQVDIFSVTEMLELIRAEDDNQKMAEIIEKSFKRDDLDNLTNTKLKGYYAQLLGNNRKCQGAYELSTNLDKGNKGDTLVYLQGAALAERGQSSDNFSERLNDGIENAAEIIGLIDQKRIPVGCRASLGIEFEITNSTAQGYEEQTGQNLKRAITDISSLAGVGMGMDAYHEIAVKPSDNPYAALYEWKLLNDLNFVDFNFQQPGYENSGRGYHLTLGGEKGLSISNNTNLLQNLIVMSNWGGVNAGTDVRTTNYARGPIRERDRNLEKMFAESKPAVELRMFGIDRWEQFQRTIITSFNSAIAIQSYEMYISKNIALLVEEAPTSSMESEEKLFQYLDKNNILNKPCQDDQAKACIFSWVKLVKASLDAVVNHNSNFFEQESYGYAAEDKTWVDANDFNGQGNSDRFVAAARKEADKLSISGSQDPMAMGREYASKLAIEKNSLFSQTTVDLVNKCIGITNIFQKTDLKDSKNDQANALAILQTTKIDGRVEDLDGETLMTRSIFDLKGRERKGYYSLQGGSPRLLPHAIQSELLKFNQKMADILKPVE